VVFQTDERRSSQVVEELVGEGFSGVVGSDFYPAYNVRAGRKQRCWAHLLRATGKLENKEGRTLHRELKRIWDGACLWVAEERQRAPPEEWPVCRPGREERARGWEEEVVDLRGGNGLTPGAGGLPSGSSSTRGSCSPS